jgi:TetR/AcrR family transcriptional regulator, transcriptional repressor for nem operon
MAKSLARESIIRHGASLIHSRGYNNTGLSDILKEARVPKGSFYFYFKSKDEFGLAVLDHYGKFISHMADAHCSDASVPPLERLERFMDVYHGLFESMGFSCGCPIGNLMQEMSDLKEDFRTKVSDIYSGMREFIAGLLKEAREKGDVPSSIDADGTALFILNSWEGAIMHMKVTKNDEPLRLFKQMVFERILK